MSDHFFEHPILNSPYLRPGQHWELDAQGQPTQKIFKIRRPAEFITPIPKSRKQTSKPEQYQLNWTKQAAKLTEQAAELSKEGQEYIHTALINQLRNHVEAWRNQPNPKDWKVHLAKGLEFKSVVVMACDDEVIPSQERIEKIGDEADLEEVYDTERHLLYVACTRARDHLLVSAVAPGSEFLADL
ncbi:MAG: 3'-5' exonuclease [Desulfobulbus sp.]|jgi:superfamily I DNA/RNA helicase